VRVAAPVARPEHQSRTVAPERVTLRKNMMRVHLPVHRETTSPSPHKTTFSPCLQGSSDGSRYQHAMGMPYSVITPWRASQTKANR
jgi:hypothetical protein